MSDRKAFARVGDEIKGVCNAHSPHRDVTGVWDVGSPSSRSEGRAIVRVGDTGTASCGHSFFGVAGSPLSRSEGRALMRISDPVNIQGGDGVCVTGSDISNSA